MKLKNTVLSLLTICALTACSGGSPSPEFLKADLRSVVQGNAMRMEMTVNQVVSGLTPGSWKKFSDTEWMLTVDNEDKVTKQKVKIQIVFEAPPELKGDVLCKRIVVDGKDASQSDILIILGALKQK